MPEENPPMLPKLLFKLQAIRAFTALVKDPNQTERIFKMGELLRKKYAGGPVPPPLKLIFENDDFKKIYEARYNPQIDLPALRSLPPETFGGSLARFLDLNGFEANAFPLVGDDAPLMYLISRLRQTHDLWHVLTGYGTGVPSELALQGFTMAQVGSVVSAMIIAGGILHTIMFNLPELRNTFDLIVEGYQRGKRARPLLYVKWEELWDQNLEELRAKFDLNTETAPATLFLNGQETYS
jgi:ubiquinone biosynthesis protein COQ4